MNGLDGIERLRGRIRSIDWLSVALYVLAALPFALLYQFTPGKAALAISLLVGVTTVYSIWAFYAETRGGPAPPSAPVFGVIFLGSLAVTLALGWILLSLVSVVNLLALSLLVGYWLVVTAAVYHHLAGYDAFREPETFEPINVIVPAYNEEGYVGRTIEALLATEYPREKLNVVVVDDGSTDGTYEEATGYASDIVTVVTKENGGKYSALNYGLMFCEGEYVITIDADSLVASDALKRIVAPLQADDDIGAVAGNVKVTNRDSLVTKCQALEYIISINIYRRMLDLMGVVTVVPGCLGAYRRDVLEDVFAYDPETLTEDFDLTIKVLKQGYEVRANQALVFTEAPGTWEDLYKQRLRWYRGNFMTVFKHWDVLTDERYGLLHRLAFPLRAAEMFFLPFASAVILASITWLLVTGHVIEVLALFVFFVSIIVPVVLLAIVVEDEDLRLAVYSPLFVVGFKHFHDVVTLKSLSDVLSRSDLRGPTPSVSNRASRTPPEPTEGARGSVERSRRCDVRTVKAPPSGGPRTRSAIERLLRSLTQPERFALR